MNSISDKKIERLSFAIKILRIMRLFALFLFLSVTLATATNTYSQNAMLNLHMKNVTIEEVINSIEKQTEYHFLYNKEESLLQHFHYDTFQIHNPTALFADMNIRFNTNRKGQVDSIEFGIALNPEAKDEFFMKQEA